VIEAGINQGLVSASFWPVAGASKRPLKNAFARTEGQLWVGSGISGPATIDPKLTVATGCNKSQTASYSSSCMGLTFRLKPVAIKSTHTRPSTATNDEAVE
jgi:hypothetical protein